MKLTKQQMAKILIQPLKDYKEQKEKEGFVPTIEMLISDLENQDDNNV